MAGTHPELPIPVDLARDTFTEIVDEVERLARRAGVDAWMLLLAVTGEPLPLDNGVCRVGATIVPVHDELWYSVYRDDDGRWYLVEAERDVINCVFCNCHYDWVGAHSIEIPAEVGARLKLVELLVRLSGDKLRRRLKRLAYRIERLSAQDP